MHIFEFRPLTKDKLEGLTTLVYEQKELGYVIEFFSPWHSRFFIKKKSGKWRMLTEAILKWVFLPHIQVKLLTTYIDMISKLIFKIRNRTQHLSGYDPHNIIVPLSKE